jgi:hypothetical protein
MDIQNRALVLQNPTREADLENVGELTEQYAAQQAAELQEAQTPENAGLPETMSAEALVAYCESRLDSLDSQMQSIFNNQQTNAAATSAIDNVASDLNDLPPPATGDSSTDPSITITAAQASQIQGAYEQAITAADSSGPTALGQQLQNDLETFQSQVTGKAVTSAGTFDFGTSTTKTYSVESQAVSQLSSSLKTYASNLNSDAQDQMIQLQSFIQDQQTVIEMSTNFLQSLGQEGQNIAANFKA